MLANFSVGALTTPAWHALSRMYLTLLSGGLTIRGSIQPSHPWPLTIFVYCVSKSSYLYLQYINKPSSLATSTAVECVFSQGWHILHFTWNHLSPSTIHTHLCLGSWACYGLISVANFVKAIQLESKRKWAEDEEAQKDDWLCARLLLTCAAYVLLSCCLALLCASCCNCRLWLLFAVALFLLSLVIHHTCCLALPSGSATLILVMPHSQYQFHFSCLNLNKTMVMLANPWVLDP